MNPLTGLPLVPKDIWKNVAGLVLVLAVLVFLFQYFDIQNIRAQVESAGAIAPILFILAKASTIVIAPLGGAPLYPIGGAIFGFWKGALLLILGDMLGGIISFSLARYFGRPLVERMLGNDSGMLTKAISLMSTTKGYAIARLCFVSLPELASYGAGLTRIQFVPFIVIYTLIGMIPILVLSAIGNALVDAEGGIPIIIVTAATAFISFGAMMFFFKLVNDHEEPKVAEGADSSV